MFSVVTAKPWAYPLITLAAYQAKPSHGGGALSGCVFVNATVVVAADHVVDKW